MTENMKYIGGASLKSPKSQYRMHRFPSASLDFNPLLKQELVLDLLLGYQGATSWKSK
jgi:hypothetical protein